MALVRPDRWLGFLVGTEFPLVALWAGLGAIGVALLVLITTRWGQSRALEKCLVLSALVHVWLVLFSMTVQIVIPAPQPGPPVIRVSLGDGVVEPQRHTHGPAETEGPSHSSGPQWPFRPPDFDPRRANLADSPRPADQAAVRFAGSHENPPQPVRLRGPEPEATGPRSGATPALAGDSMDDSRIEDHSRYSATAQAGLTRLPQDQPLESPAAKAVPPTLEPADRSAMSGQAPKSTEPGSPPGASVAGKAAPAQGTQAGSAATGVSSDSERPGGPLPDAERRAGAWSGGPGLAADAPHSDSGWTAQNANAAQVVASGSRGADRPVPEIYRLRTAPNRSQIAQRLGSSPEAEAAVSAALKWLAENQQPDGRWSARQHGGGRETFEEGRDRQGAGSNADTGVTGLAILAMAAAGNTHLTGPYRSRLNAAVSFLLAVQAPDGNLAGKAEFYEFMYCHAMATLALAELLGMSGDPRLEKPVRRAAYYIVAAQDPNGGGWRYRPAQPGDTSQLGWQLMALKSAELAGIDIPETTWRRAGRFLQSVSGGKHQGLASYRPGERFTRPMTAEALACRVFLGVAPSSPACREAADYLLGELPGQTHPGNLYYWYYATLGLYPMQGEHWTRWSTALQKTLINTQRKEGPLAGSWDPTGRWDGYGGRVYTTALGALCLETYYRFFPPSATPVAWRNRSDP
ncbi:MAG: hypothetical protein ACUVUC_13045 [Thermoguttaceae bacterium]